MSALYRLKHMRAAANYLLQGLVKYDQSQPGAWTDELNTAVELQTRLSEACVTHGDDFCPCIEDGARDAVQAIGLDYASVLQ